jgi:hypothetical protein
MPEFMATGAILLFLPSPSLGGMLAVLAGLCCVLARRTLCLHRMRVAPLSQAARPHPAG